MSGFDDYLRSYWTPDFKTAAKAVAFETIGYGIVISIICWIIGLSFGMALGLTVGNMIFQIAVRFISKKRLKDDPT